MIKPSVMTNSQIVRTRRDTAVNFLKARKVTSLSEATRFVPDILAELKSKGVINPRTRKPYTAKTIRTDLAESIGQFTYVKPQWQARILLNTDLTPKDWVFWDALRRGTAPGYTISGPAFCMPAAQTTASYVFGKGISASLMEAAIPLSARTTTLHEAALSEANGKPTQNKRNAVGQPSAASGGGKPALTLLPKAKPSISASDPVAFTNQKIHYMLESNQGFLQAMTIDNYCLGNVFLFVNPDCSFSVASPETVTIEYSASDYRRILKVIVRTKMQNARVEDVYTDQKRVITVHYYDGRPDQVDEYENLIGRIPMIHWANDRSINEVLGRPIFEGGLPIMWRYDALIQNMLEGVTLLGTPIPMFTNLDNPTETKMLNSEARTYQDDLGNQQTEYTMRLDRQTGLFLGKGGDGKMLSTNVGFTKDSIDALRELKLLWLNETHIPEFVLGGAIASSKASTDSQLPPFIQYINFRRLLLEGQGADPALGIEARGGLLELIDIWLRTYKLLNPAIVVGPVQLEWPEIDLENDQVKYLWGTYLSGTGKISDETALKMSGYFTDPAAEVMKASGKKARPPRFDDYEARLRQARLEAARAEGDPPDDDPGFYSDYVTTLDSGVVAEHQHASGAAVDGDPWNPFGALPWIGMFTPNGG